MVIDKIYKMTVKGVKLKSENFFSILYGVLELWIIYLLLFKILKTIQSRTRYKRSAEVKRIHVYKIYLQKVPRNKRNLNKSTNKIIK